MELEIGSPYNINFHNDRRFSNYNWLAMGGSGSGKSFTFGTISYQFKLHYPDSKIIIVDLDGSYEGICAAFGGNYITFDPDRSDERINPFHLSPGKTKADNETIQMWRMDLEQRLVDRSSGQKRLSPEDISQLETMLSDMVETANGREFTLSDLRSAMERRTGLKKLSQRLNRWCQGGAYGNLSDGPTTMDLTNDFLVFDLKHTANNPELAPVIFTTVANLINQLGERYIGVKKLLAFDEAWKILKDEHQQSFLELAFRAYRKKGFSVGGISQGIAEWANLPNGEAFANNITNIIISRLDASVRGSQMDRMRDFLNLPESALEAIGGLETVPGQYAEVVLVEKAVDGVHVNKLVNRPSPLFYALATTKPSDKAMIKRIQETEELSLIDAKIKFSERYPNGT
jgi:type IV secretory pathway VirB4 component